MILCSNSTLRPWRSSDAAALIKYANNQNIWLNMRNLFPYPYTPKDAQYWFELNRDVSPPLHFAIEYEGEAIGSIGLNPKKDVYAKSIEIGYWIGEPFWGKGIVTEAIGKVVSYGFETFDIVRVNAVVFSTNTASMKALEKNGFRLEGVKRKAIYKGGKFLDEHEFAVLKEEWGDT